MAKLEPRPRDVDTEDLRVLLAVARVGRMTSAASLLGIDHTTVRRRLDRLEAALQTRLVHRSAEGWELTPVGRAVAEQAGPLEQLVSQVLGAASGSGSAPRGPVQVFTTDAFGIAFASRAIGRVAAEYPGITVDLVTSTRPLGARPSGFDIAVTVGRSNLLETPSVHLTDYMFRLYASREYLARNPPITSVEDLRQHALVYYIDALLPVRYLDLTAQLGDMHQGFGSTNILAQLEATRHGTGIGLLPTFLGRRAPNLVEVLPEEVQFQLSFHIAVRRPLEVPPAVEVVRQALIREVRERRTELMPPRA